MHRSLATGIGFATWLFVQACGSASSSETDAGPSPAPSFSWIQENVFKKKCNTCHAGASPSGGVDYSTYDTTIASGVVKAGEPDSSQLFKQVNTGAMPKGGTQLSDGEIQAIKDWISAGAKNN